MRYGEMKPVHTFLKCIGWQSDGDGPIHATLLLSEDRAASTSRVLHIEYDRRGYVTRVETANSIYTRR